MDKIKILIGTAYASPVIMKDWPKYEDKEMEKLELEEFIRDAVTEWCENNVPFHVQRITKDGTHEWVNSKTCFLSKNIV